MKTYFSALLLFTLITIGSADWREDALFRIDQHRKANIKVSVLSEIGSPVADATVSVKLKRHQFLFGAVVRSSLMLDSPYSDIYKENYKNYFNAAGAALYLKPKWYQTNNELIVDTVHQWFRENNFMYRGHSLIWEGEGFLPPNQLKIYNDATLTDQEKGDTLVTLMEEFLEYAIEKWDVEWWDVVNEPVVNNIVNELLPDFNTFAHWFKLADSLRTVYNRDEVKLVLNENQIISTNAKYSAYKADSFATIIDSMFIDGAPIEMIGFQSRIKNGMIPADNSL